MYCPSCGSKVPDGTKFCEKCGMPIKEAFDNNPGMGQQNVRHSETSQKIKDAVEQLGLTKIQKVVAITAAASALVALICITGTFVSWITAIAALLLTYLCVNKFEFSSKAMAIAFSVFAARFLWLDFSNLFNGGIHYSFFAVLFRIITYGCTVVYWLTVLGTIKKKELGTSIFLLGTGLTALYAFIKMFGSFGNGFRSAIFYLGWIGFIGVYAILIITDGNTIHYIKKLFAGGANTYKPAQGFAQYCPHCGNGQPADAVFCDKCGTALTPVAVNTINAGNVKEAIVEKESVMPDPKTIDEQQEEFIICEKCGNKLELGSLFCDSCGNKISPTSENDSVLDTEESSEQESIPVMSDSNPIEPQKSVCPKCGNVLEDGSVFCDQCGNNLSTKYSVQNQSDNTSMGFMNLNEFIIDEKVSAFKFENSYKIYDMNGAIIGAVQQNEVSGGAKAARLLVGSSAKNMQKFKLDLLSAEGKKLGSIHRDGGAFASIFVDDANGDTLVEMKLRFGALKDMNDNTICKFKLAGLTKYPIKDANGNTVAEITHKWNGAKSIFTTADKYHISISPALTGRMRQIICSVAIAFDMLSGDR